MKEPDLVTVVFGHLPAARLCALLRTSSVWMLHSDQNSSEVDAAARAIALSSLSGQISSVPRAPSQELADWLRTTLAEIDSHHDGYLWTQWRRIDVMGLEVVPELEAVARDFGEVSTHKERIGITCVDDDG